MIALMIRQMKLQQMQPLVDGLGEFKPLRQSSIEPMPPCNMPRVRSASS